MLEVKDYSFIYKYFTGEKQESLFFLLAGLTAIILSVVFYFFVKTSPLLYKGAAIPLMAIGLIQLVVGYTVYAKSDKQQSEIAYKAGMDPGFIKNTEIPRMEKVMKNFIIYRYTEMALALLGIGLFVYFRNDEVLQFWKGIGIALAIQALLMLGADGFAEKRGQFYCESLSKFSST